MEEIKISIDDLKQDFKSFLDMEQNSRIFFSGKFGIGKTYFLSDFFKSHNDDYEVFHLYPINYQINKNEDIVELLKYDILMELIRKNENIFELNETKGIKAEYLLFYAWLKEEYSLNQILQNILSFGEKISNLSPEPIINYSGKLGRPLKEVLRMDRKYQGFKKEYEKGEKGLAEKYTKEMEKKDISEIDYMSHLLKEKILQQKSAKKSVLVLDDLDRIDPEHIFRLLNIFSAHFEKEKENKFGFDSVIIVADYSNIRHIFHHLYGNKTDFSGYIDKFFTISPYYFDNKKAVIAAVDKIVKSIKNEEPNLKDAIGESGYIKLFLEHIFIKAVDSECVNLRELLKATNFQISTLKKGSFVDRSFGDNNQKLLDIAVKIVIISFSSIDEFIKRLEIIKQIETSKEAQMPFHWYIVGMLKSFNIEIPSEVGKNVKWRNFNIVRKQDSYFNISVDDNRMEELFYDLLISYIQEKKYIKNAY